MNWRRVAFWVVVLGLVFWIVSNPGQAAATASGLVMKGVHIGESVVMAVADFVDSLT